MTKSIHELGGQSLHWVQPNALHRAYELHAGDEIVATLKWEKPEGSLARAETVDGGWTLKRSGFLAPRVTVRLPGAAANLAVFKPGWRGEGLLEWPEGLKYYWLNTGFWGCEWVFANAFHEPLVHLQPQLPPLGRKGVASGLIVANLRVEPAGATAEYVPLLAVLGWYLLVLMADDTAVATGAV